MTSDRFLKQQTKDKTDTAAKRRPAAVKRPAFPKERIHWSVNGVYTRNDRTVIIQHNDRKYKELT